jgi:hypothetical protein
MATDVFGKEKLGEYSDSSDGSGRRKARITR